MEMAATPAATRLPYGVLLARLGTEATAGFRRALRPLGLGAQEFIVLKQVQAMGPSAQGSVGDALGIDPSNLASMVAVLCDRDLLERERDEADRRRYILRLSGAGEELIAAADRAIVEHEEQMVAVLSEGERLELWELLRRVADAANLCPSADAEACMEEASTADACLEDAKSRSRADAAAAKACVDAVAEDGS